MGDYVRDDAKLQEGPPCLPLRVHIRLILTVAHMLSPTVDGANLAPHRIPDILQVRGIRYVEWGKIASTICK